MIRLYRMDGLIKGKESGHMGSAIFIFGIAGMAVCILLLIILPKFLNICKTGLALPVLLNIPVNYIVFLRYRPISSQTPVMNHYKFSLHDQQHASHNKQQL